MVEIENPIVIGFFPDPSIYPVGEDCYLANSVFGWFHGVPLHSSCDLLNWQFICDARTHKSQLDLTEIAEAAGVWAASLSYVDGRIWLIQTIDIETIRDYIHIRDLAQAHILGLQPRKTGFYNLGNGDGYSVRQVIQMCEKVTGKNIPAVKKSRRPGDPPRLVASAEKTIRELGWKPEFPKLEDIVATAWAWHKVHPTGYRD